MLFHVPTHPSPPSTGHRWPEESSPVLVLKDVWKDAAQDTSAVQDHLLLLLTGATGLCTLHQLLHRLRLHKTWIRGTLECRGKKHLLSRAQCVIILLLILKSFILFFIYLILMIYFLQHWCMSKLANEAQYLHKYLSFLVLLIHYKQ